MQVKINNYEYLLLMNGEKSNSLITVFKCWHSIYLNYQFKKDAIGPIDTNCYLLQEHCVMITNAEQLLGESLLSALQDSIHLFTFQWPSNELIHHSILLFLAWLHLILFNVSMTICVLISLCPSEFKMIIFGVSVWRARGKIKVSTFRLQGQSS